MIDNLAELALTMEDYDMAEARYGESLAMNRAYASRHGIMNESLSSILVVPLRNLVNVLLIRSKTSRAKILIQEGIEHSEKYFGRKHPVTASWLRLLANTLLQQKQFEEAKTALQQSLEIHRIAYGNIHPEVASDLLSIAVLMDVHDDSIDKILELIDEAIEIRQDVFGIYHPLTLKARKVFRSLSTGGGGGGGSTSIGAVNNNYLKGSYRSNIGSVGSFHVTIVGGIGNALRITGDEEMSLV
jgi:tetratricopeptide (TPR) repeat protein